jgi:hypothetical protein
LTVKVSFVRAAGALAKGRMPDVEPLSQEEEVNNILQILNFRSVHY